jgi:regulator of sigma E protease
MNTFLAINWSAIGLQAAQLILSLSILVIMHELGHFIPAKIFKCRVEKFYLFFDPYFSLFKKKIGETVYGIGWLPLGGYVKISGMVDESMDKEQLNAEPQPWEFRSKPAWQRLIIMIGGVSVNIILAFFIYAMVLFTWGETKLPMKNMNGGIWAVDSISTSIGLKTGDKIISVNKKVVTYFDDLNPEILMGKEILLQRNGVDTTVYVPESFIGQVVEQKKRTPIVLPRIPAFVGEVADSSAAQTAGLIAKDQIVEIDSIPVTYFDQIKPILQSRKNQQIAIKVKRDGQIIALSTLISGEGQIGFFPMIPSNGDLGKMNFYNFEV